MTTVEPCTGRLELELGPDGRLLFLSDIHLTGGGAAADFVAANELGELLDQLGRHEGEVLLLLGGDVLDLLQAGGTPVEAVERVFSSADARAVGAALRGLAARADARVVYLVGNHDAAIAWDGDARRQVVAELGACDVALSARVRIRCRDGRTVTVVAEHGHELDVYNRHTDPFDPLESPAGDHVVREVVNRFDRLSADRPDLQLDEIDNVRPSAAVPVWLVSNFFYRFLRRALRRFAGPLTVLFVLLHVPVISLVLHDLRGKSEEVERMASRALVWLVAIVAVDLVLFLILAMFLGRSLRDAAATYGGTPQDENEELAERAAAMGELLILRNPGASVLLTGHTHRDALVADGHGRVVADSGCWVRALVPVRAWLALPPVFVRSYPCTWVELTPGVHGVEVALWRWPLAVTRKLSLVERLAMRDRPPSRRGGLPELVSSAVATPDPGPVRADWTPGRSPGTDDGTGSQRWAGMPVGA
jgi:UDP-2,3-diacylglucosamine pyrophosphatase LpxH